MAKLPAAYQWLNDEPGPRLLKEGLELYGTYEFPGSRNNPTILAWAQELGLSGVYQADSIPWCGLYMAYVCDQATWPYPKAPLWARNWAKFGVEAEKGAELGDVLVFTRGSGGHVAIYVGETGSLFHCLGGNQSDAVNIRTISKSRCIAQRRPDWRIAEPPNRRKVYLKSSGQVSTSEQ